jgi:hypothetical protein
MNIFFYEVFPTAGKLAFTVSEKTESFLRKEGIIPSKSKTVIRKYDEFSKTLEGKAILAHIDKVKFDDEKNPTNVILDLELLCMFIIDIYRELRKEQFDILDSLQMRALLKNKTDIVNQIEIDKELLRNLPDTLSLKYSNFNTVSDIVNFIPRALGVDYNSKYEYKLK